MVVAATTTPTTERKIIGSSYKIENASAYIQALPQLKFERTIKWTNMLLMGIIFKIKEKTKRKRGKFKRTRTTTNDSCTQIFFIFVY